MKLFHKLSAVIEKNTRLLIVIAVFLICSSVFLFMGQNFVLRLFLNENTLDMLGKNYATSFETLYSPVWHIQNIISGLQESHHVLLNQRDLEADIFTYSRYFNQVEYIDSDETVEALLPGEIAWRGLEIINNEPFLVLVYCIQGQGEKKYLEMQLSLENLTLSPENISGFAVIENPRGDVILTVLDEPDWRYYDEQKRHYQQGFQNEPMFYDPISPKIEDEQYRITEISFSVGDDDFFMTVFFVDDSVNASANTVFLIVSFLFPPISIVLFLLSFLSYRQNRPFVSDNQFYSVIAKGENSFREFKSALRWDYEQDKLNKDLENVILKSVAAFTNAGGGKLFIGVKDDGSILGLEKDYSTLKVPSSDYFELHVRNIIDSVFGRDFAARQIRCTFHTFGTAQDEGKEIVVINVKQSDEPIYITLDQKGKKTEKFFVRSGNSSRSLDNLSEIMRYIKKHF
ncbi:MAG: ATP-binding protein [Spirochaetales bacterium]